MELTRRSFVKLSGVALLAPIAFTEGCAIGSVEQEILNYLSVGVTAFQNIVAYLKAQGVSIGAPLVNEVLAAFAAATGLVQQFLDGDTSVTFGAIAADINDIIAAIQAFFAQSGIPESPILSTALGLAEVILETLAGFLTKLQPSIIVGVKLLAKNRPDVPTVVTPVFRKHKSQFVAAFNAKCVSVGHPELSIK
jgi:hypothetical protein